MIQIRRRLMNRVPDGWRAAFLTVAADRPIQFLTLFAVAIAILVGLLAADAGIKGPQSLIVFCATVVALGLTRGIISVDRTTDRWFILFQRPDTPERHYTRVLIFTLATAALLLFLCALALLVTLGIRLALGAWTGAVLWALICIAVTTGISACVKRFDLELALLLILVSFSQGFLFQTLGLRGVAGELTSYALIPIDGLFMTWNALLENGRFPGPTRIMHLVLYPLVWLAIAAWRLHTDKT